MSRCSFAVREWAPVGDGRDPYYLVSVTNLYGELKIAGEQGYETKQEVVQAMEQFISDAQDALMELKTL